MLKVSVIGDTTRHSRELLRILVNHPDAFITHVDLGVGPGKRIDHLFRDLTGDITLATCDASVEGDKALFVCARPDVAIRILKDVKVTDMPVIIDFTGCVASDDDAVRGVCEVFRKPLVRGATKVLVPHPVETAVSIALAPFAKSLLLNTPINVEVSNLANLENHATIIADIRQNILSLQSSFSQPVIFEKGEDNLPGGLKILVKFDTCLDATQLREIFDQYYDDHNFVYRLDHHPAVEFVLNTNKCLASVTQHDGRAEIHVVLDNRIKGGAGTAVHILNLMFRLHERAGLNLKPSH